MSKWLVASCRRCTNHISKGRFIYLQMNIDAKWSKCHWFLRIGFECRTLNSSRQSGHPLTSSFDTIKWVKIEFGRLFSSIEDFSFLSLHFSNTPFQETIDAILDPEHEYVGVIPSWLPPNITQYRGQQVRLRFLCGADILDDFANYKILCTQIRKCEPWTRREVRQPRSHDWQTPINFISFCSRLKQFYRTMDWWPFPGMTLTLQRKFSNPICCTVWR